MTSDDWNWKSCREKPEAPAQPEATIPSGEVPEVSVPSFPAEDGKQEAPSGVDLTGTEPADEEEPEPTPPTPISRGRRRGK